MGIRMSIGAEPGSLVGMVLKGGMSRVLIGLGIGLVLAVPTMGIVRSMLFGIEALDPVTFVGVILLLATVAFVAAWIPAMRASRVDPIRALKAD